MAQRAEVRRLLFDLRSEVPERDPGKIRLLCYANDMQCCAMLCMLLLTYADPIVTPIIVLMRSYCKQVLPMMLCYAMSMLC